MHARPKCIIFLILDVRKSHIKGNQSRNGLKKDGPENNKDALQMRCQK